MGLQQKYMPQGKPLISYSLQLQLELPKSTMNFLEEADTSYSPSPPHLLCMLLIVAIAQSRLLATTFGKIVGKANVSNLLWAIKHTTFILISFKQLNNQESSQAPQTTILCFTHVVCIMINLYSCDFNLDVCQDMACT